MIIKLNFFVYCQIDRVLKNLRMFELQKMFGDTNNLNLLSSSRKFIAEEILNEISKNVESSIILYLTTDLLIISKRQENQEKLFKTLHLTENSLCKDHPDTFYFQNVFSVTEIIKELQRNFEQQQELLLEKNNVKKQINRPIKVRVIGTEELEEQFSKFTIYII